MKMEDFEKRGDSMSNLYLYAHGGSGNHGCEAIVRSTLDLLKEAPFERKILISSRPHEDIKYGINELCEIEKDIMPYSKFSIDFVKAYLQLKLKNNYIPLDKLDYKKTLDHVKRGDVALSIGGDNYCYADVEKYIMLHEMFLERGARTILWGCSVEPEVIKRKKVAEDLSKYSYIFARESISYEALKKVNKKVSLISDPAFTLECKVPNLPQNFKVGNMVGINISPMIIENENISGITMESYRKLMDYIINETNMGIALIPHVVWNNNDDRKPLMQLYREYENTGRIIFFEDHNCMELKGIISKCRFFVGARTHSTIAAYSMEIPTLVVGYSVKARGIARDLFGDEEGYVLSVQKLEKDNLINAFKNIMIKENEIRKKLKRDEYKRQICDELERGMICYQ